jgi:hypothetical protein
MKTQYAICAALALTLANSSWAEPPKMKMTTEIPEGITTPDNIETRVGDLNFFDGVPDVESAQKVYNLLDFTHAYQAFMDGTKIASMDGIRKGILEFGPANTTAVLFEGLMDSKALFLTANTTSVYMFSWLEMGDEPMVIETPPNVLGFINDHWFRYVIDFGNMGPDKGKGGKFLVLPPGYEGEVPKGYHVARTNTYGNWVIWRGYQKDGSTADAVNNTKKKFRIYPLSKKDNPPKMEYFSGSGKSFNTIHANDYTFYEHVHEVLEMEPLGMLDPETRGLFASIGMEKGKEFKPDARMKRILTDAVAIGNAAARSIVWYPRTDGTMKGVRIYPDTDSAWIMAFVDKNVFFNGPDGMTMNSDARVMFHYPYTGVTPAMALTRAGAGSDYGIAYVDSKKMPFDGSKTYRLRIPPNPPAKDFWAITLYDNQTRSQLQTSQAFPSVGSQTEGIKKNADGSYDIYFAPKPPKGFENNWLETIPGKGWFVALRMYGPLEPWIEKTWRPGEIELVK